MYDNPQNHLMDFIPTFIQIVKDVGICFDNGEFFCLFRIYTYILENTVGKSPYDWSVSLLTNL